MPTDNHLRPLEEEYQWQKEQVVRFLRMHRGSSTHNQLVKGLGFTPPLDRLIESGVIRTTAPYGHYELMVE